VLALVTDCDPWSRAVTVGAHLAASWGASLTGCYIDPDLWNCSAADSDPSFISLLSGTGSTDSQTLARPGLEFVEYARELGAGSVRWAIAKTGIARTLRQLSAWHDVAIVEREMIVDDGHDVLGEALVACRMPCIILPPDCDLSARFDRIVIGWNSSLEATRAIHAALPLLVAASDVCILDGSAGCSVEDDGLPRFDPYAYLAQHNVDVRIRRLRADARAAGQALLQEATDNNANLLVMGAYSHSRMRERIYGGATRHVLANSGLPIFVQH
jgi:nucleotide-binding universal stress UspA family protein